MVWRTGEECLFQGKMINSPRRAAWPPGIMSGSPAISLLGSFCSRVRNPAKIFSTKSHSWPCFVCLLLVNTFFSQNTQTPCQNGQRFQSNEMYYHQINNLGLHSWHASHSLGEVSRQALRTWCTPTGINRVRIQVQ